ncbi:hypothetical protein FEM48_Zijuj01G0190900 [Ziziphus jujuba var. spinosa]|uniref:Phytocyanin domain-containing protein n=1 Tax=Ziziphus jujuba var. spinosa TaxID=714518 RepID=A0A978W311_ZIZJJ|nr:hypothetical protein FEM48_Zijuj01G0190900 [Ziziphus jujuba var. spinosa]
MDRHYTSLIGLLILGLAFQQGQAAVTHEVGDALGWTIPTEMNFYSSWADKQTFHVGDKLDFKWNGPHNVAKVTKEEYESCTATSADVSESSVVLPLTSAGTHYFICTVGKHCEHGQKLAVKISSSGSPSPSGSPSSPTSSSPAAAAPQADSASSVSVGALFAVMSALLVSSLA